jgi:hypothetical protein
MIEGSARLHSAPTKCHEPSDSTAHWGLRSCTAAKIRHSPAFEQGTSYLNLIGQPAERRWSWWGRLIFYVADVDALYDRALAADSSPLPCPTMPNGVSASSTSLTPTTTNSVSLGLCSRFPSNSSSKRPAIPGGAGRAYGAPIIR